MPLSHLIKAAASRKLEEERIVNSLARVRNPMARAAL